MDDDQSPPKTEPNEALNFQWSGTGHAPAVEPASPSGEEDEVASPTGNKPPAPAQKRRRVTRACDECRRKKIKCDGKQPCTHCTVYSYECTYDQPSNRRRNPTPQYIEALESRLHRAETILKALHIDLNDPNVNLALAQSAPLAKPPSVTAPTGPPQGKSGNEGDSLLESMVQDTGSLDIDDEGHLDFHGHSSGMVFLQRLRQQFGDMLGKAEGIGTMLAKPMHYVPKSYTFDSPKSSSESPFDVGYTHTELPPKETGIYFCELSMSDACSLMRFIHKPTLWKMFHKIYDTPDSQWGNEEHRYLPLIFALMAVGTMFASPEDSKFQKEGYAGGIDEGFKWFKAARQLLEITDCRDIPSVQAVVCMIMFLQSTAKLSTCWCYVGIALHSAIRMGLHRSITRNFNPVELESRKRLFWQIRKMDVYVGAMIGLPTMLSEDDIDQDLPLDIDDEFITTERIKPVPPGHIHLMTGSNAHIRLMSVLRKVIKYVYPIKGVQYMENKPRSYVVAHAKIREIERDLQHWMEELPMFLRPGGQVSPELARVQQLLRMAYAYVQMFLYRPFLHYVSKTSHHPNTDKRSYACAAACVSVSRNVIHITQEMSKRGLLIGSFWFVMYTTFLAIMALVFFALENPESRSSEEIIMDAMTGKNILAGLAKNSMAADRCTQTLGQLFDKLPERLKRGRAQSLSAPAQKKRQAASPIPVRSTSTSNQNPKVENHEPSSGPQRASTFPAKQSSISSFHNSQQQQQPSQYAPGINFSDPSLGLTTSDRTPSNEALAFSQLGIPPSKLPQATTTYGIPDVTAVMFPSNDPFDYPNQPMTTLENDAFADTSTETASAASSTRRGPSPNLIFPINPRNPAMSSAGAANSVNGISSPGGYDPSIEAQIFDPLQPYLSGSAGYQQVLNGDLLADMGSMGEQGIGVGGDAGKGAEGFGDWWTSNGGGGWGL